MKFMCRKIGSRSAGSRMSLICIIHYRKTLGVRNKDKMPHSLLRCADADINPFVMTRTTAKPLASETKEKPPHI